MINLDFLKSYNVELEDVKIVSVEQERGLGNGNTFTIVFHTTSDSKFSFTEKSD